MLPKKFNYKKIIFVTTIFEGLNVLSPWIFVLVKASGMYLGMGWSMPLGIYGCLMKKKLKCSNSPKL